MVPVGLSRFSQGNLRFSNSSCVVTLFNDPEIFKGENRYAAEMNSNMMMIAPHRFILRQD